MEKQRYAPEELEEFRQIILEKLALTRRDYEQTIDSLTGRKSNDDEAGQISYKAMAEGSLTQSKEELTVMAQRQMRFIQGLEAALKRIENGTYGICRATGKLIPKERLRAVPHATLTIEAKNAR